ncbi:MAG: tetratricopeptide repeat protein [Chloroflexota bacterium]
MDIGRSTIGALRRLVSRSSWAARKVSPYRLMRARQRGGAGPPAVEADAVAEGRPLAVEGVALAAPAETVERDSQVLAEAREPEPEPSDPLLEEAMGYVSARQWGRAQQLLERGIREGRSGDFGVYLSEVRAIRRCERQLRKWPRDETLYLELGRRYFALDLGEEALSEFSRAIELNPGLAEAHHALALEYLFENNEEAACHAATKANELDPSLPTFAALQEALAEAEAEAGCR